MTTATETEDEGMWTREDYQRAIVATLKEFKANGINAVGKEALAGAVELHLEIRGLQALLNLVHRGEVEFFWENGERCSRLTPSGRAHKEEAA